MRKGFSIIETVVYVGILAIVLPVLALFLLNVSQQFQLVDPRIRMEQKASLMLQTLRDEISKAESIDITSSTLGADGSILIYTDSDSQSVTLDRPTVSIEFPGATVNVRRVRLQRGVLSSVHLSDADIDVTNWVISPVRNSSSNLTGLRISLEMRLLNPDQNVFRSATFSADSTIVLQPQTSEL